MSFLEARGDMSIQEISVITISVVIVVKRRHIRVGSTTYRDDVVADNMTGFTTSSYGRGTSEGPRKIFNLAF